MSRLKEKIAGLLPDWRQRVTRLLKEHGDVEVNKVVISQFYGGMRGIKCLTTDISYLDPMEGIRFRGYTIPEVLEKLPKAPGAEIPYVEGHLYLLLTGDIPSNFKVAISIELTKKSSLPSMATGSTPLLLTLSGLGQDWGLMSSAMVGVMLASTSAHSQPPMSQACIEKTLVPSVR